MVCLVDLKSPFLRPSTSVFSFEVRVLSRAGISQIRTPRGADYELMFPFLKLARLSRQWRFVAVFSVGGRLVLGPLPPHHQ